MDARGRRSARRIAGLGALAATALALGGCGSSGGDTTGSGAVHGRFPVTVSAHFAQAQRLAQTTRLRIAVHNSGHRALPDVAVTICETSCTGRARLNRGTSAQAFGYDITPQPNTADPSRPLWIVQRGPGPCHFQCNALGGQNGGGATAVSNTWALGRLTPGATAHFTWTLTPVQAGRHVVAWEVDGNLTGTARAVGAGGGLPRGTLAVTVSGRPEHLRVTSSGRVVTTSSSS